MPFALVRHLDPAHESRLSELLAHASRMRVLEIKHHTQVEPNVV
jgi:chemotaxis response regulator CheB